LLLLDRPGRRALVFAASASLALTTIATTVATASAETRRDAARQSGATPAKNAQYRDVSDDFATPLQRRHDELRERALEARLAGKKFAQGDVVRMAKGQAVDLELEGTDKIFAVLVEFGDEQYPDARFQGPPPDGSTTDVTGPVHNEIAPPDRSIDNSTLWQEDYDQAHYEDMYFDRMRKYYERQSTGRYSIEGVVTEWIKVPFNEALYGRNYCGGIVCNSSKALVRDALAVWVQTQLDAGMTIEEVRDYLRTFDEEDRYDIDGDENFDEPDGVIDHFQLVHAGGDEAAGDPHQGTDAIWSHRSGANLQAGGPLGVGVDVGTNGGIFTSDQVPNNSTGVWVYDYTVQPENGGLGVFAHEFGHDLGLPDLYDTSGNTGGAENNTAFWTLMSSGANIGDGGPDGIGDAPTDMSAWERLRLGWLAPQGKKGPFYEAIRHGERAKLQLGTNVPVSKKPSALVIELPPHERELGPVDSGEFMFWSGAGNLIENTMTRDVAVAGDTPLTARVRYQIEEHWDYAYLEASSDGTTWTPVRTNVSREENPNGQNDGFGITGSTNGGWVDLSATIPDGTTAIRFRYWTDPFVEGQGLFVDEVRLGSELIGSGETPDEGWAFDNDDDGSSFIRTKEVVEGTLYDHFYIAENRQHDGDDESLRTAYNFGFLGTGRPDWVETHPYMKGMLVWYWDTQYSDNNVGDHPGHGELLPVDAHPQLTHWPDGTLMRNRILSYDSTFGRDRTRSITLHNRGVEGTVPSRPAVSTFDDTKSWWVGSDEHSDDLNQHPGRYQPGWYSVDVPQTGTRIKVTGESRRGQVLHVEVNPRR
jgi:immune inhibitor A